MGEFKATGVSYLVRSKGGTYYWQAKIGGRSRRGSLKTRSQSVAKTRLMRAIERARARYAGAEAMGADVSGLVTVADWMDEWVRRESERVGIKESTLEDYRKRAGSLKASSLGGLDVGRLEAGDCRRWWRKESKELKPVSANNNLRVVKLVVGMAWKELGLGVSPAEVLERKPVRNVVRQLPTGEDVKAIAESIRRQGKFRSKEVAAMVEFLAYSGTRPGEAREVRAADIQGEWLLVRGGKEGTKNRRERLVPITEDLKRVIDREGWREAKGRLFDVASPTRAMRNACERLELPAFRVYDLRHFFVTSCIESGVDVPTVARWAGHQDGGVLIMKTYTHTRSAHHLREAARVKFV